MAKSNGSRKIGSAVFISGNGSNLKNLIKFSYLKSSPIEIKFVLSNKRNAKGLIYPKKYNIKYKTYDFSKKSKIEKIILKDLNQKNYRTL